MEDANGARPKLQTTVACFVTRTPRMTAADAVSDALPEWTAAKVTALTRHQINTIAEVAGMSRVQVSIVETGACAKGASAHHAET
jgi:hypothetical protein